MSPCAQQAEMDPDGNGEVTLDEFRGWWRANISAATNGSANEEVAELKLQLAEAQTKLKKVETQLSSAHSTDPLQYVKSARSKLRKVTPGRGKDGAAHRPVQIDIDADEVAELVETLEDESDAADLCRESGIDFGDADVPLDTMKAALRGHFSKEAVSVREAFDQLDVDDSGYLDEEEVEQAIAMLGFLADDVSEVMKEMDPNGDGEVSFEEFEAWWKGNMEGDANSSGSSSAANQGDGDAATHEQLAELRRQLQAALAGGQPMMEEREASEATLERLKVAEAAEADARSQLAAMTKQLAEVQTRLAATEGTRGAGSGTHTQQEVAELRAKLDAAEQAASQTSDPMGMLAKLQEYMERAARAEAEQAVVSRERDKALEELASARVSGGAAGSRRAAGGKGQGLGSDDEDEDDLQEQVELLEQVVAARDAEVKSLTEKLKAFAGETRRLIEQLKAETDKSKELAKHYSALQADLDAAESKLDEMAQLNRTLVGQISELKGRLLSHSAPDEV